VELKAAGLGPLAFDSQRFMKLWQSAQADSSALPAVISRGVGPYPSLFPAGRARPRQNFFPQPAAAALAGPSAGNNQKGKLENRNLTLNLK
jgi:hypothetical protein